MGNYPQCAARCWLQLLSITPQTASSSVSPSCGAARFRHGCVPARSCCWKPRAKDGSSSGGREPWRSPGLSKAQHRGNTTTAGGPCQLQPHQEAVEDIKGKFLQLTGEQRCVSRLKREWEGSVAREGSSPLLHPHSHSPAPGQDLSYLLRLNQLELHAPAGPCNEVGVGGVIQEGDQELPELQGPAPLVGRALTVQGGLLLHFTCPHQDTWLNTLALPLSQAVSPAGDMYNNMGHPCAETHEQDQAMGWERGKVLGMVLQAGRCQGQRWSMAVMPSCHVG